MYPDLPLSVVVLVDVVDVAVDDVMTASRVKVEVLIVALFLVVVVVVLTVMSNHYRTGVSRIYYLVSSTTRTSASGSVVP